MRRLLWGQAAPEKFAYRISLYARLRHKPLHVSWNQETGTFEVRQGGHAAIHVSRPNRIKEKYLATTDRLDDIYRRYLIEDIRFIEGDVVIDVGANIGELSLVLLRRFGIFPICCEPDPAELRSLRQNLKGVPSAIVENPLWNEVVERKFYLDNDRGDSSLFQQRDESREVQAVTETLDRLAETILVRQGSPRVRLLKLEAEGAEPEILEGGEKLLERVDFVAADLGPERGREKANTIPQCVNFLLQRHFRIVKADARKAVFLFENNNRPTV